MPTNQKKGRGATTRFGGFWYPTGRNGEEAAAAAPKFKVRILGGFIKGKTEIRKVGESNFTVRVYFQKKKFLQTLVPLQSLPRLVRSRSLSTTRTLFP